jgi:hypothetical protein
MLCKSKIWPGVKRKNKKERNVAMLLNVKEESGSAKKVKTCNKMVMVAKAILLLKQIIDLLYFFTCMTMH